MENLFKSKEEREKEFNEYKNKIFPLGESQKNLAISLLKSLISNLDLKVVSLNDYPTKEDVLEKVKDIKKPL